MASAQEIAQVLGLQEHREGGMFRELYRSVVRTHATKQRRAATSIFYMLRARDVSTWHLVKSDEIWMYHAGSSAVQLLLLPDGTFEERVIGPKKAGGCSAPWSVPDLSSRIIWRAERKSWSSAIPMRKPGSANLDFNL